MTFNSLILLIGCKDLSTGWKSNNHKINLVENQLFYFLEKDFLNENQCHVLFFPRFTEWSCWFFSLGTVYPYRNKPWCDFYEIKLATSLIKSDTDEGLVKTFEWRQRFSYNFIQELLTLRREQCNNINFDWLVLTGLTLEDDLGEEVALWRLTLLSRWSKAKFKSPYHFWRVALCRRPRIFST